MDDYRTHVEIDLAAIRQNAEAIKTFTGKRLIAVVKADAYGHGVVPVTQTLRGVADMFAVATVEEGVKLRQAGVQEPILVLFSSLPNQASQVIEHGLVPTISDWGFADRLNTIASDTIKVHVNINTGMNRSGVHWTEATQFLHRLKTLDRLTVAGVFTHLATADEPDKSYVFVQIERFASVLEKIPNSGRSVHAANSAATLAVRYAYFDAVRPGLSLYGIYPASERPVALEPALTWKARIGWIGSLSEGEGVSYGLTYKAPHQSRVATVQVGYGDGYPRALSNVGEVLIGGVRRSIIGRVCMDVSVVGLESTDNVSVGDEVVLIGEQGDAEITVNELAHRAGTIPYEILTQIGARVPRIFKHESFK